MIPSILLAAGYGRRLLPFSREIPKPLLPVLGCPVAQFSIDRFVEAGSRKIVANTHHLATKVVLGLNQLDTGNAVIVISQEQKALLGTAGGVARAMQFAPAPRYFIGPGDVVTDIDLADLLKKHEALHNNFGVQITMAVAPHKKHFARHSNVFVNKRTNLVTRISNGPPTDFFYTGFAVIEESTLARFPRNTSFDLTRDVLKPGIHKAMVGAHVSSCLWSEIGTVVDWVSCHFEMMYMFEKRSLPESVLRRLLEWSVPIAPMIWCGKDSMVAHERYSDLVGPMFWGGKNIPLGKLGPFVVSYGSKVPRKWGIEFQRRWRSIPQKCIINNYD